MWCGLLSVVHTLTVFCAWVHSLIGEILKFARLARSNANAVDREDIIESMSKISRLSPECVQIIVALAYNQRDAKRKLLENICTFHRVSFSRFCTIGSSTKVTADDEKSQEVHINVAPDLEEMPSQDEESCTNYQRVLRTLEQMHRFVELCKSSRNAGIVEAPLKTHDIKRVKHKFWKMQSCSDLVEAIFRAYGDENSPATQSRAIVWVMSFFALWNEAELYVDGYLKPVLRETTGQNTLPRSCWEFARYIGCPRLSRGACAYPGLTVVLQMSAPGLPR